ncbi:host specificity factor TipJ family phage tail protein [Flexibacterium corallicola]|uniref:host specificity factor TipJ family phage tail protein n=1 Tax=Flexibacterium corallicola TaxID=3037259 RepID=UPI00286F8C8C|nr:host specificity factor TipJ family phage tail protein [Pseudovibrio sp. M1P-2-3]
MEALSIPHQKPIGTPHTFTVFDGETVASVVERSGLSKGFPIVACVNGLPVLRKNNGWDLALKQGDCFEILVLPAGGEGGDTGKTVMRIVGMIAVAALAAVTGGAALAAFPAIGAAGAAIVSGVITTAGGLLVNTLLAPKSSAQERETLASSPTYTINAVGNTARLYQPIPVQYGRFKMVLDYASDPYQEYEDNDQYVYYLFSRGCGRSEVNEIYIGETKIWDAEDGYTSTYTDLEIEQYEPGEQIDLFPVQVEASEEVGSQTIKTNEYLGPFVAVPAGETAKRLAVDVVWPLGGYKTNDDGSYHKATFKFDIEYQEIDDNGDPLGSWQNLASYDKGMKTKTAKRKTFSKKVPSGRYQVRILRHDQFDEDNTTDAKVMQWGGLRAYLDGPQSFANVSTTAVKIRANEQLQGAASKQFSIVQTRILPVWNGSAWVEQPSRSICWAAIDVMRNSVYGAGLSDTHIDYATFMHYDSVWASNPDTFDGVFDSQTTIFDALNTILAAGRSALSFVGHTVSMVRDEPRGLPRQVFTDRNIVAGSLEINQTLLSDDYADDILVEYMDGQTWRWDTVRCSLATSSSSRPTSIRMMGVSDRDHAWSEGMHIAADNAFRRRTIRFTTELEGRILQRGDVVEVQSHVPQKWGRSGVIEGFNGLDLTLSEEPETDPDNTYLLVRRKDGGPWGPIKITWFEGSRVVTLDGDDTEFWEDYYGELQRHLLDSGDEAPSYAVGEGASFTFRGIVVGAEPQGNHVTLTLKEDDPRVYLASSGVSVPERPVGSLLPPSVELPQVMQFFASRGLEAAESILSVQIVPVAGAEGYICETSLDDGVTWDRKYSGFHSSFDFVCSRDAFAVRVCAIGAAGQGPWKYASVPEETRAIVLPAGSVVTTAAQLYDAVADEFKTPVDLATDINNAKQDALDAADAAAQGAADAVDAAAAAKQEALDAVGEAKQEALAAAAAAKQDALDAVGEAKQEALAAANAAAQGAADAADAAAAVKQDAIDAVGEAKQEAADAVGEAREIASLNVFDVFSKINEIEGRLDQTNEAVIYQAFSTQYDRAEYKNIVTLVEQEGRTRAQEITSLGARLQSSDGKISGQATALQSIEARVESTETGITSNATSITGLNSSLSNLSGSVNAHGAAIQSLETTTGDNADEIETLSNSVTALQSNLSDAEGGIDANSEAMTALTTRVTSAEGGITSISSDVTSLQSGLNDAEDDISANASAVDAVTTRVTDNEGEIISNSNRISNLKVRIKDTEDDVEAGADATTALTTRVTSAEGSITSITSDVTSLQSGLNDAEGDISANASAVDLLNTEVVKHDDKITSHAGSISSIRSRINDAEDNIDAGADATSALTTRVTSAEGDISSMSSDITSLQSDLTDAQDGVDSNASALSSLNSTVSDQGDDITSNASKISDLKSRVKDTEDDVEAGADATTALTTRVTSAEGSITSISSDVTNLQSGLNDAEDDISANASAVDAVTTRVTDNEGEIISNSNRISNLKVRVKDTEDDVEAGADATTALTTRVTSVEGSITSISSDVTSLQSSLNDAEDDISANASAVDLLNTEVVKHDDKITSHAGSISSIRSRINDAEDNIDAGADATSALTTRVTSAEGDISSNTSKISDLKSRVKDTEDDVEAGADATTALTTRVTSVEGSITSITSDVTSLQSGLNDAEDDISANASAVDAVTTRVTDNEGEIISNSNRISNLKVRVKDTEDDVEAGADATTALTTRVTSVEGSITSISSDVTSLQSSLNDAEDDINANASAVDLLNTEVVKHDDKITSHAGSISSIRSRINDAEDNIDAGAGATSALTTRVTSAEGSITSISSDVTSLQSGLNDAEDDISANASAVDAVTTRVTDNEGEIISNSNRISSLKVRVKDTEDDVEAGADATTALTTRVSSAEGDISSLSSSLTSVSTRVGDNESSVSALASSVDGLEAKFVVRVETGDSDAGFYIKGVKKADGTEYFDFVIKSDKFVITDGTATAAPFVFTNGTAYIDDAVINEITTDKLTLGGTAITTQLLEDRSITKRSYFQSSGKSTNTEFASTTISTDGGEVRIDCQAFIFAKSKNTNLNQPAVHIRRDGTDLKECHINWDTYIAGSGDDAVAAGRGSLSFTYIDDDPGAESRTYKLAISNKSDLDDWYVENRCLTVTNYKK